MKQEVLAESIESIGQIADEIVVLDTGSTDRAGLGRPAWRTFTARLGEDFSAARITAQICTRELVLWLDAGERIRPQHAAELRRFLSRSSRLRVAYSVWVKCLPRGIASASNACKSGSFQPTLVCNFQAGLARH